jgi:hypothetical protein
MHLRLGHPDHSCERRAGDGSLYRCALPLPMLAVLAVAEQRRHGRRPVASRGYAVLAGLFLAANLVLWIHSIADVGAGVATVLGSLQVLFVTALAWAILRERPGRSYLVTLPVAATACRAPMMPRREAVSRARHLPSRNVRVIRAIWLWM